jgi:hypothetical protein
MLRPAPRPVSQRGRAAPTPTLVSGMNYPTPTHPPNPPTRTPSTHPPIHRSCACTLAFTHLALGKADAQVRGEALAFDLNAAAYGQAVGLQQGRRLRGCHCLQLEKSGRVVRRHHPSRDARDDGHWRQGHISLHEAVDSASSLHARLGNPPARLGPKRRSLLPLQQLQNLLQSILQLLQLLPVLLSLLLQLLQLLPVLLSLLLQLLLQLLQLLVNLCAAAGLHRGCTAPAHESTRGERGEDVWRNARS